MPFSRNLSFKYTKCTQTNDDTFFTWIHVTEIHQGQIESSQQSVGRHTRRMAHVQPNLHITNTDLNKLNNFINRLSAASSPWGGTPAVWHTCSPTYTSPTVIQIG